MEILDASASLEAVERFRYEIYVQEQGKSYAQADHDEKRLRDELDHGALHYLLRCRAGRLIGYFRVHNALPASLEQLMSLPPWLRDLEPAFMSRLMLSPRLRGTNAAIALLSAAYVDGLRRGRAAAVSYVRPELRFFYERLGLHCGDDRVIDPGLGTTTIMILLLRDLERLQAVRSPLLRITDRSGSSASVFL
nr:hypothetical protein [uncultured Sphingomonas sp.]